MEKNFDLLLANTYNKGFSYERDRTGCSQTTMAAVLENLSLPKEDVFKAASALSGGLYTTGKGPCGAFLGGLLIFSSLFGRSYDDFCDAKRATGFKDRVLAVDLEAKFINEYGSINCKDIQKKIYGRSFNLADPKEFEAFEKAGAHVDKCPSVVGNAAKWIVELLKEE